MTKKTKKVEAEIPQIEKDIVETPVVETPVVKQSKSKEVLWF